MTFRALLAASLLLPGVALADDASGALKVVRQSLERIQQQVEKARVERHPVKLTCAAEAEDVVISAFEQLRSAQPPQSAATVQRVAEVESGVNACVARPPEHAIPFEGEPNTSSVTLAQLFPEPPEVSFARPVR